MSVAAAIACWVLMLCSGVGIAVGQAAAAFGDDLVEEALGGRHMHHADDFAAAAGLAEDGDVAGIAAEAFDVVVNPLERGHQVGRAGIAGVRVFGAVGREIEGAQDVQPVIHADDHDVAELAEVLAFIGIGFHRGAIGEPAAVHPDHDGLLHLRADALRPDVQTLAVLVLQPVAMRKDEFVARRAWS